MANQCNAPILADTETLLQRIYASQKYLHVYTLSISTGKNQSTEASGALYIPTYEYNYKVITKGDPILQEYYITDMRNCEITKRCTSMNSTQALTSLQKENSRGTQGAWKDSASDGLLEIHASAAPP